MFYNKKVFYLLQCGDIMNQGKKQIKEIIYD